MDRLFTLSSNTSVLSQDYFPPIELDKGASYALGLYNLSTFNSVPNVIKDKNDIFNYFVVDENYFFSGYQFIIPEGAYEIEALEKLLFEVTYKQHEAHLKNKFQKDQFKFSLKPNVNTQKVEILASFPIHFPTEGPSVGEILGFHDILIAANTLASSNATVKITTVDVINVECNIVSGSYINGQASHTLYSFCHSDVPAGYKISQRPTNLLFLPLNTTHLSNITLRLVDQEGKLVNFRNEQIVIQLILRKTG